MPNTRNLRAWCRFEDLHTLMFACHSPLLYRVYRGRNFCTFSNSETARSSTMFAVGSNEVHLIFQFRIYWIFTLLYARLWFFYLFLNISLSTDNQNLQFSTLKGESSQMDVHLFWIIKIHNNNDHHLEKFLPKTMTFNT